MANVTIIPSDAFFKSYPHALDDLQRAIVDMNVAAYQAQQASQALRDMLDRIGTEG